MRNPQNPILNNKVPILQNMLSRVHADAVAGGAAVAPLAPACPGWGLGSASKMLGGVGFRV